MQASWQLPINLALAVLITACQPSITELRRDLDKGIGGFTGPVAPFSVPYDLRYEPSIVAVTTATTVAASEQSPVTTSARMRQRISVLGSERLVEAWVDEFSQHGRVYRSSGKPWVTIRQLMSPKGLVAETDVEFAGMRDAPAAGSPEHRKWATQFKQMVDPLPDAPVHVGSEMFTGLDATARLLDALLAWEIVSRNNVEAISHVPVADGLVARIMGQTTANDGRTLLVVEISGTIRYHAPRNAVGISMTGHGLLDPQTGLYRSFLVSATLRIEESGRPDTVFDAVTRRETQ